MDMGKNRKQIQDAATQLFDKLDSEGYEGWLCVREQDDNARIKDWSFLAAKSPLELFQLVSHLVEFLYTVEDDNERC